jgi:hypothetical protein
MAIDECPSISDTIFGFTLRVSSSVAHVFRRSWKRFSGSPARFSSGLNFSFVTLEGAVVGVHVVPLQPEQLSLTEAGVYRQHVEGFEAVPSFVRHLKQGGGSRGLAVVMLAGHTSRKIHVHFHERNHNGQ